MAQGAAGASHTRDAGRGAWGVRTRAELQRLGARCGHRAGTNVQHRRAHNFRAEKRRKRQQSSGAGSTRCCTVGLACEPQAQAGPAARGAAGPTIAVGPRRRAAGTAADNVLWEKIWEWNEANKADKTPLQWRGPRGPAMPAAWDAGASRARGHESRPGEPASPGDVWWPAAALAPMGQRLAWRGPALPGGRWRRAAAGGAGRHAPLAQASGAHRSAVKSSESRGLNQISELSQSSRAQS